MGSSDLGGEGDREEEDREGGVQYPIPSVALVKQAGATALAALAYI